jgi:hypothetical protein
MRRSSRHASFVRLRQPIQIRFSLLSVAFMADSQMLLKDISGHLNIELSEPSQPIGQF